MKAILLSIKPKWVAKILNGEKTIEIRKQAPKCDLPIDVYLYCSKGKYDRLDDFDIEYRKQIVSIKPRFIDNSLCGKICAKFTLNKIKKVSIWDEHLETETLTPACLSVKEFDCYTKGQVGYAWYIKDLVVFFPKELSDFNIKKAPQSYQFMEV